MNILTVYDGSLNAQLALKYGLEKIKDNGGRLIALHVFNSGMFVGYDALPGAEDVARQEAARYSEDAKRIVSEHGAELYATVIFEEGNPEEEVVRHAREDSADLIISPPRYKSLAKNAPCPVAVIPGNILVPVDKIENFVKISGRVAHEARAAASKVLLLGIVPVHLYSRWENKEVDSLRKTTSAALRKAATLLHEQGIETREFIRSGYPDLEIAKVADEYPISMIIIAEGGDTSSELGKAASMLLDDSEKFKQPILLMTSDNVSV